MADIDIHRAHQVGLKGARAAAERMAEVLGKRFDLRGEWSGNVLNFQRPGVTGTLSVSDRDLRLSVTLGFLLKALRGSIESAIHEELDKLFAPAKAPPAKPAKKDPPRRKKGG